MLACFSDISSVYSGKTELSLKFKQLTVNKRGLLARSECCGYRFSETLLELPLFILKFQFIGCKNYSRSPLNSGA